MRKIITFFLQLTAFLVLTSSVSGQIASQSFTHVNFTDKNLTDVKLDVAKTTFSDHGILPNHPLYAFKRGLESLQVLLTFDNERKAALHQEFAKTRLAEAKKLFDDNNTDDGNKILQDFDSELNESEHLYSISGKNVSAGLENRKNFMEQSNIVLVTILDKAPDRSKPAIENAMRKSSKSKDDLIKRDPSDPNRESAKNINKNDKTERNGKEVHDNPTEETADASKIRKKSPVNEPSKTQDAVEKNVESANDNKPVSTPDVPIINVHGTTKI